MSDSSNTAPDEGVGQTALGTQQLRLPFTIKLKAQEDWDAWKTCITMNLRISKLQAYLVKQDKDAYDEQKDSIAFLTLFGTLDPVVAKNCHVFKTTHELWKYLQSVYEPKGTLTKFRAHHRLLTMKRQDYKSLSEALSALEEDMPSWCFIKEDYMQRAKSNDPNITFQSLVSEARDRIRANNTDSTARSISHDGERKKERKRKKKPSQQVFRLIGPRKTFHELQSFEEPIPTISNREVLVHVRAVALNYRDIGVATSTYPFPVKDAVVPCSDAAGEIVEVGSAVAKDLAKGDTVVGTFDPTNLYGPQQSWRNGQGGPIDGVLRQYVVLPADAIVKVPREAGLSFAQWASLVCTGVTAWNALYGNLPLRPGQVVLLQGTGGVSITGLILAKAAGATTIITSSSDDKLKYVREKYGVDHTINYKTTPDWAQEALRITGGRGADFILENGGAGTIKQSIEAITMGGIIAVIGFLAQIPQSEMPDVALLALGKGAVVRGVTVGSTQLLEEVVRFVGSKKLNVPVETTFGFTREEILKAYEYLQSGQHVGKVCINVE
ncbi:hypothetical protein B0J12DRAFT_649719 [Macrophomina phaseolina]|uniref:Enoyl reductase (ER) domain-containing protein n=1 Tax=Macrophomina phaseolina TaxID=35725 RepID=A0ABQ8GMP0_9PEZI|nr:hypothetical protein B0J12DRAFT_649719 [Macrophomina phaseolina]